MKTFQYHIRLTVFCLAVLTAGGQTQVYAGQLFNYLQLQEATVEKTTEETEQAAKQEEEANKKRTDWSRPTHAHPRADYFTPTCSADSLTKRAAQCILSLPDTDQRYLLLLKLTFYGFFESLRH